WAAWQGGLAVAAGSGGAAGIEGGAARWIWPAPTEATGFHLLPERAALVLGGSLCLLDALSGRCLWRQDAPGAGLGLPAPAGRIHWLLPLGRNRLLAQASTRLWVLDTETGKIVR